MADSIALPALPLQQIIPSYLYQEYADDSDLQAFVNAYNTLAQSYLVWFNTTSLGLYTSSYVFGQLLDWIAAGIYGLDRPVFSSGITKFIAGINSGPINAAAINAPTYLQSGTATPVDDDYFKRIITWWVYAGVPNRFFNVMLLRKRVARFLYGVDGTDITLSQAETVHIQAEALEEPPAPILSYIPGGSLAGAIAGLNSGPINGSPINGSALGPITYYARQTYVSPIGETLAGAESSLTVPPNNLLVIQSPPPLNGALGYNDYVGTLPEKPKFIAGLNSSAFNVTPINGSYAIIFSFETKQNADPIAIGTDWTEPTSGLIEGAPLPNANTANIQGNFIIIVPPGASSTIFKEAFDQGALSFPFQLSATVVIS